MYLRASGRQEAEILAELEPEAELALKREAVITAIVATAQIGPTDDEVLQALAPTAEREGIAPETLRDDVAGAGRLQDVREDIAARQAIDLVAASAKPIPVAQAQAREQLWTPDKAKGAGDEPAPAGAGQLWTPGS
jgi:trigger factor